MFLVGVLPAIIAKCCNATSRRQSTAARASMDATRTNNTVRPAEDGIADAGSCAMKCSRGTTNFIESLNFSVLGAYLFFLSVSSISDLAAKMGVSDEEAATYEDTAKRLQLPVQGGLIVVGVIWNFTFGKYQQEKGTAAAELPRAGCKSCCWKCLGCCDRVSGILVWPLHIIDCCCVRRCCGPSVHELEETLDELRNAEYVRWGVQGGGRGGAGARAGARAGERRAGGGQAGGGWAGGGRGGGLTCVVYLWVL
jgi:hypothetical protein